MDNESLFSKDGTVARSSQDIVRFFYLQRLEDLIRSQKGYYNTESVSGGRKAALRSWKACLTALFSLCKPRLKKRSEQNKNYQFKPELIQGLITDEEKDLNEATDLLINYLELDLKITKIDTQQTFEATDIMGKNKARLGY